jgi:hypothetical protein
MQVNPGAICRWTCTPDFLEEALRRIDQNGSTLLTVTPARLKGRFALPNVGYEIFDVQDYLVFYKNPPAAGVEGEADEGSGDIPGIAGTDIVE